MKRKEVTTTRERSLQRKKKQNTGKALAGEHANNAERFMAMCCASLDRIADTYTRTVPKKQPAKNYPLAVKGEKYSNHAFLKHFVNTICIFK